MHYNVLADYINENDIKTFCELGVKDGRTSRFLLENTDVKLYGVDLWELVPGNKLESYDRWNHKENHYKCMALTEEYSERCYMFQLDTVLAAEVIPDVDMVFIDADHSYDGVKSDIIAWQDKCKILSGHDIEWSSVQKAVSDSFSYKIIKGSNVWIRA